MEIKTVKLVEISEDSKVLARMGYVQELDRRMSGFSNFAISFSVICILAGGLTSFHLGFSALGGAAIGIGWPLACVFSLIVAMTMGQLASAFPTAGGLYHWAAILGGRGFGWMTAWFNLAGLVTVLAAINVGTFLFIVGSLGPIVGLSWEKISASDQFLWQSIGVGLITLSQAMLNHRGIRLTTRLTDFSGYLILAVSVFLTLALLGSADHLDWSRLVTITNFSGPSGGNVWPQSDSLVYLFALSMLLPAYTITGFDASAHTSEETRSAQETVPRGIVRSVLVSGIAGWALVSSIVLAMPSLEEAAGQGSMVFFWVMGKVISPPLALTLLVCIAVAQYLCGLATVTSASRMMFAFARDNGLPASAALKKVSPRFLTPAHAIWTVALLALIFTLYTPVYSTITVVCVIFLYLSYVLPVLLGLWSHGRTWTVFGPWTIGRWYKPFSVISVLGCAALLWIGVQPPNDAALTILGVVAGIMVVVWFGLERRRFLGPPNLPNR
jgi:amino acid transporter